MCYMWKDSRKTRFSKDGRSAIQARPFTYSGEDIFGLELIRRRRSQLKRDAIIVTCFSDGVIRIEFTNGLDTNSIILAIRRLMNRRDAVRPVWSKIEINLFETRNGFQQVFNENNHNEIKDFLQENGADWIG